MPYLRLLGAQAAIGAAAIFARFALTGDRAVDRVAAAPRDRGGPAVHPRLARRSRGWLSWRREAAFALAGVALAVHFRRMDRFALVHDGRDLDAARLYLADLDGDSTTP